MLVLGEFHLELLRALVTDVLNPPGESMYFIAAIGTTQLRITYIRCAFRISTAQSHDRQDSDTIVPARSATSNPHGRRESLLGEHSG